MPRGVILKFAGFDDLVKSGYQATDKQVEQLAGRYLSGLQSQDTVKGVYLKVLVADAQQAAKPAKSLQDVLKSIETSHEHYYAAVLKGVSTPDVRDDDKLEQTERSLRSLERNRRSNFARSAKSLLVTYVKRMGDLQALKPETVSKQELQAFITAAKTKIHETPETLEHKSVLSSDRTEELARQLADEDEDAAVRVIQGAMNKLAGLLAELGKKSTRKTLVAVKEHRPLQLDEGLFWPMAGAVAPTPRDTAVQ
jgi:hypothetical protein